MKDFFVEKVNFENNQQTPSKACKITQHAMRLVIQQAEVQTNLVWTVNGLVESCMYVFFFFKILILFFFSFHLLTPSLPHHNNSLHAR